MNKYLINVSQHHGPGQIISSQSLFCLEIYVATPKVQDDSFKASSFTGRAEQVRVQENSWKLIRAD